MRSLFYLVHIVAAAQVKPVKPFLVISSSIYKYTLPINQYLKRKVPFLIFIFMRHQSILSRRRKIQLLFSSVTPVEDVNFARNKNVNLQESGPKAANKRKIIQLGKRNE